METLDGREMASGIVTRARAIQREQAVDFGQAQKMAAAQMAMEFGVEASDILKARASYAGKHQGQDRPEDDDAQSLIAIYEEASKRFDLLPADAVVSHFTGASEGAIRKTRSRLCDRGFGYEGDNKRGWTVMVRPPVIEQVAVLAKSEIDGLRAMLRDLSKRLDALS